MSIRVSVNVDSSRFAGLAARVESALDFTRPGPAQDGALAASEVYRDAIRQRFEGASGGDGTWPELAESTKRQRERTGESEPLAILNITGSIYASLARGDGNSYENATPDSVAFGTQHRLARIHQDGAPSRNLPARPMIVEPDADTLGGMGSALSGGLKQAITEAARGA